MAGERTPRAVIAEDEALMREALVEQLRTAWPALAIVAECEDGASALEAIAEHAPDVAFLDIRMPGLTGLDVAAAAADASPRTQVVFVTAYDQYALDAFDAGAIDYLLKPIVPERLAATVQRVRARIDSGQVDAGALAELARRLGDGWGRPREPLTWITASAGRETRLILVEDVLYFRAEQKYTTVVTAAGEAIVRMPIKELAASLDPAHFRQVHRSTLVNLRAVASVVRDDAGRGTLRLRNRSETLTVSAPFMALFRHM